MVLVLLLSQGLSLPRILARKAKATGFPSLSRKLRDNSPEEVIAAGVRLLRQHEEAEEARVVEGIRQGLEDMHAGRGRPAEEVFADILREFNLPPDA